MFSEPEILLELKLLKTTIPSTHLIFFPNCSAGLSLDKYARESIGDNDNGESPASFGFLYSFAPAGNRISALALRIEKQPIEPFYPHFLPYENISIIRHPNSLPLIGKHYYSQFSNSFVLCQYCTKHFISPSPKHRSPFIEIRRPHRITLQNAAPPP